MKEIIQFFHILKKSFILIFISSIKFYKYLKTEKGIQTISLLPLFFNWLIVLSIFGKNEKVKESSIYSALFSFYFFSFVVISMFIDGFFPFYGNVIASIVHFLGITLYLGLSGFFIYLYHYDKRIEIKFIQKHFLFIYSIVETGAHSSTG